MSKKTMLLGAFICSVAFTACNNDSTSDADKMKADSIKKADSIRKADSMKMKMPPKDTIPMDSSGIKPKGPVHPVTKTTQ